MNVVVKVVVVAGAIGWLAAPAFARPAAGRPAAVESKETGKSLRPATTQTRVDESGEVKFTVAASTGEVLLVAEAPGIVFEKRSTADSVAIRVAVAGESVRIEASWSGDVRLTRGRSSRRLRPGAGSAGHVREAQEFMAGSKALQALEVLAARLEASARPEAESIVTSRALIEAIQGRSDAARSLARRHRGRTPATGVRPASFALTGLGTADCWGDYTAMISDAFNDYESCLQSIWWGWPACSFEYAIRAEGTWFSYIACSGGLPV